MHTNLQFYLISHLHFPRFFWVSLCVLYQTPSTSEGLATSFKNGPSASGIRRNGGIVENTRGTHPHIPPNGVGRFMVHGSFGENGFYSLRSVSYIFLFFGVAVWLKTGHLLSTRWLEYIQCGWFLWHTNIWASWYTLSLENWRQPWSSNISGACRCQPTRWERLRHIEGWIPVGSAHIFAFRDFHVFLARLSAVLDSDHSIFLDQLGIFASVLKGAKPSQKGQNGQVKWVHCQRHRPVLQHCFPSFESCPAQIMKKYRFAALHKSSALPRWFSFIFMQIPWHGCLSPALLHPQGSYKSCSRRNGWDQSITPGGLDFLAI